MRERKKSPKLFWESTSDTFYQTLCDECDLHKQELLKNGQDLWVMSDVPILLENWGHSYCGACGVPATVRRKYSRLIPL